MSNTTLWCLVEGDTTYFSVVTLPTTSIGELKELIKIKKENTVSRKVDASNLNLWKVDVDFGGIRDAIQEAKYRFKPTDGQKPLWDEETISEIWHRSPSRGQLHVYVTLPANMRSSIFFDTTSEYFMRLFTPAQDIWGTFPAARLVDYLWLEEFHPKIWGRKELEGELFREVKVTHAHYTELQARLNQQYPDRNLPEYDGSTHDVRSVKLDVLRMMSLPNNNEGASQMDVDNPEASNVDDSGTNWLFPSTLRFLDLTILRLENVPPRLPFPLFLRQEYHEISRLIWNKPENKDSVVVSGQPGTGKTSYLHLSVVQFMIEGRPFLYQAQNGIVYRVDAKGVQVIGLPPNEHIVAFVDGDKDDHEPDHLLLNNKVRIILTSPPKGSRARWINQAAGHVKVIATKLWSEHELFIAGIFLYPFDISLNLLRKSTSCFGYNPRQCFDSAQSVNALNDIKVAVKEQITSADFKQSNMLQLLYSSRTGESAVSHSIFQISPIDEFRRLGECGFDTVSRWAFDRFMETYELHEVHMATTFFRRISRAPEAASLWSHVFERQALNHIDADGCDFEIRRLYSSGKMRWGCPGPIRRANFLQQSDFIDKITKAFQDKQPLHLVPSVPNIPAIDSILYIPNEELSCIQVTISTKHGIQVPGLRRIQSWLQPGTVLADLRPSVNNPWRFIFIVPPGEASTFTLQRFEGDTSDDVWDRKVHQYVLGLDVLGNKKDNV